MHSFISIVLQNIKYKDILIAKYVNFIAEKRKINISKL